MPSSTSGHVTDRTASGPGRRLLKLAGWLVGIGVLSLLGVLLLVVVVVAISLRSCANTDLNLFGSRTISAPAWCREQAAARPFLRTVNLAGVGGDAWPEPAADAFPPLDLGGTTITGRNEVSIDRQTIIEALRPGAVAGDDAGRKIESSRLPGAQAAAARLDRYCDSHVGPVRHTTSTTRP